MKKIITILFLLIFLSVSISSCKKQYNCACEVTLSDGSIKHYHTTVTATKKNKQSECEATAPESDFGKTCTVN